MSLISDGTIRRLMDAGALGIRRSDDLPMDPKQFQTASVDVRLKHVLQECWEFNPRTQEYTHVESVPVTEMLLRPNGFVLGTTCERLNIPPTIAGDIKGKSSLARLGLGVEFAGFLDPGWEGEVTLEIKNLHPFRSIRLQAEMLIAQIRFQWTDVVCERPYGHPDLGSHYKGQEGATQSCLA